MKNPNLIKSQVIKETAALGSPWERVPQGVKGSPDPVGALGPCEGVLAAWSWTRFGNMKGFKTIHNNVNKWFNL